ncbi:hypothetical protein [Mesorhizobium sp. INR15]|uniref:hypothetical protein n=1 Tax=Mesorhizobium sp. INR15 TaxID=2654248 RepID=UPI0018965171|nr:hypothetical protein [Mesorhizobium sp. INR15]QPC90306.1 hypothetical protein GA829_06715 [Mesorhizobium sp. INR15]
MTKPRATARRLRAPKIDPDQALLDAIENAIASTATAGHIDTLRGLGFSDPYITASLLAGVMSLIRTMPNKAPWSALLRMKAEEVAI